MTESAVEHSARPRVGAERSDERTHRYARKTLVDCGPVPCLAVSDPNICFLLQTNFG